MGAVFAGLGMVLAMALCGPASRPVKAAPPPPVKNILMNASFEFADAGDTLPYWWGCWRPDPDMPHTSGQIDNTTAFDGKNSIRFEASKPGLILLYSQPYRVTEGKTYTFSGYAKGEMEGTIGVQWELHAPGKIVDKQGVTAPVAKEWTHFSGTFTIPTGKDIRWIRVFPQTCGKGTVWLDCIQVEEGDKATEWSNTLTPKEQAKREYPIAISPADGIADPNIAAFDSFGTLSCVEDFWGPKNAFDGKMGSYYVSNYPAKRVPKDIIVRFRKKVTLTGMEISYLIPEQSPTLDGYQIERPDGKKWRAVAHKAEIGEGVDIITSGGKSTEDKFPRWTITFKKPLTTDALRLYFSKVQAPKEDPWPRPAIREVVFKYAEG